MINIVAGIMWPLYLCHVTMTLYTEACLGPGSFGSGEAYLTSVHTSFNEFLLHLARRLLIMLSLYSVSSLFLYFKLYSFQSFVFIRTYFVIFSPDYFVISRRFFSLAMLLNDYRLMFAFC
jgi:hypothetical protein